MLLQRLPDVSAAVNCFLSNFQRLRYPPFIDGVEVEGLFGPQVAAALLKMDDYNRKKQICSRCQSRCCQRVKCELYDARFSGCLVENSRPALCRFHFCQKYRQDHGPLVEKLGDIYLDSLLAAGKIDRAAADVFDCPAFWPRVPHFMQKISGVLEELRNETILLPQARCEIQKLIDKGAPGF